MKLFVLKCFTAFSIMSIMVFCVCGGIQKTLNMKNCEYSYKSVNNVTISNINVSKGISVLDTPKILLMLSSLNQSIPLNFLLTLDVKNPNNSEAAFYGMLYKVIIDGIHFSEGGVDDKFSVAPGETKPMSIKIGTDVTELVKNNSKDSVLKMVKNFIGIGNEKTKVRVELKPKFRIGGQTITSPTVFPVEFEFGGK